jgi:acyl-coenzyme A synthetase/AMP-(fatty) acid ligase
MPAFMVPHHVQWREEMPRNPNGKYDRPKLAAELKDLFATAEPRE